MGVASEAVQAGRVPWDSRVMFKGKVIVFLPRRASMDVLNGGFSVLIGGFTILDGGLNVMKVQEEQGSGI